MPTTRNCPGCQTPLRLREDMAGRTIRCPRCGLAIPIAEEELTPIAASPAPKTRNASPTPAHNTPRATATRRCPECGEPLTATASKCPHCPTNLKEEKKGSASFPFKPCPRCGETTAKRVKWTAWGSFYGPALFTHVRCPECGYAYNGKTGRSNLVAAFLFVLVTLVLILGILAGIVWYLHYLEYY